MIAEPKQYVWFQILVHLIQKEIANAEFLPETAYFHRYDMTTDES